MDMKLSTVHLTVVHVKDLGKLENFTNLNLKAIKGDDFLIKINDSQGSVVVRSL